MIKLSVAAALLLGANAVQTTSKGKVASKQNVATGANIDYLGALTAIPEPDPVQEQTTLAYWTDNTTCYNLFQQIIDARKQITTDINTYITLIAEYQAQCNSITSLFNTYYRQVQ